jgi:hypothetical protein
VGLVYTNGHAVDEYDRLLYDLLTFDFSEPDSAEAMLLNCYIESPSSVMNRRTVLEKTGRFDSNLRTASDHDLWIRTREITRFF